MEINGNLNANTITQIKNMGGNNLQNAQIEETLFDGLNEALQGYDENTTLGNIDFSSLLGGIVGAVADVFNKTNAGANVEQEENLVANNEKAQKILDQINSLKEQKANLTGINSDAKAKYDEATNDKALYFSFVSKNKVSYTNKELLTFDNFTSDNNKSQYRVLNKDGKIVCKDLSEAKKYVSVYSYMVKQKVYDKDGNQVLHLDGTPKEVLVLDKVSYEKACKEMEKNLVVVPGLDDAQAFQTMLQDGTLTIQQKVYKYKKDANGKQEQYTSWSNTTITRLSDVNNELYKDNDDAAKTTYNNYIKAETEVIDKQINNLKTVLNLYNEGITDEAFTELITQKEAIAKQEKKALETYNTQMSDKMLKLSVSTTENGQTTTKKVDLTYSKLTSEIDGKISRLKDKETGKIVCASLDEAKNYISKEDYMVEFPVYENGKAKIGADGKQITEKVLDEASYALAIKKFQDENMLIDTQLSNNQHLYNYILSGDYTIESKDKANNSSSWTATSLKDMTSITVIDRTDNDAQAERNYNYTKAFLTQKNSILDQQISMLKDLFVTKNTTYEDNAKQALQDELVDLVQDRYNAFSTYANAMTDTVLYFTFTPKNSTTAKTQVLNYSNLVSDANKVQYRLIDAQTGKILCLSLDEVSRYALVPENQEEYKKNKMLVNTDLADSKKLSDGISSGKYVIQIKGVDDDNQVTWTNRSLASLSWTFATGLYTNNDVAAATTYKTKFNTLNTQITSKMNEINS